MRHSRRRQIEVRLSWGPDKSFRQSCPRSSTRQRKQLLKTVHALCKWKFNSGFRFSSVIGLPACPKLPKTIEIASN